MDESLKEKVAAALAEACKPDDRPEIQLDDAGSSIGGLIVSGSFAGKSPHERQDHIWHFLDQKLNPHERTRISFIVTETPEEHRVLEEDK
jgi:stage V sporulation protein SpoVS